MIPALILAVAEKDASSVRSFAISAAAVIIAGLIGLNFTGRYRIKVKARDSYFVVDAAHDSSKGSQTVRIFVMIGLGLALLACGALVGYSLKRR